MPRTQPRAFRYETVPGLRPISNGSASAAHAGFFFAVFCFLAEGAESADAGPGRVPGRSTTGRRARRAYFRRRETLCVSAPLARVAIRRRRRTRGIGAPANKSSGNPGKKVGSVTQLGNTRHPAALGSRTQLGSWGSRTQLEARHPAGSPAPSWKPGNQLGPCTQKTLHRAAGPGDRTARRAFRGKRSS